MTLIAASALERALLDVPEGALLPLTQRMHQLIKQAVTNNDNGQQVDDGMELGACYIPAAKDTMVFVGACLHLLIVDHDGLQEIRGTRAGLGYPNIPDDQEYRVHDITLDPTQRFYLTSDGLTDQVGGPKRAMFSRRRFKALIGEIAHLPLAEQKHKIHAALMEYQGQEERRDDVAFLGFQVVPGGA